MMEIPTRRKGGVTILDPKGKITIGDGDIALRETIDRELESGAKDLLINFSRVRRMDSSGLGELVASVERAKAQGVALKFTNLPANVEELLTMTTLIQRLEVFSDEDSAVASFG